jgi:hypothetical protein
MCSILRGNTKPLALLAPPIDEPKRLTSRATRLSQSHEVGTSTATMQKPVSDDVRLRDDETDARETLSGEEPRC